MPTVLLAHRKGKRTKERTRPPGCCEPCYHHFLALRCLDLQPVVGAGARQIFAVSALCHDALKAFAFCLLEELFAICFAVTAERLGACNRSVAFDAGRDGLADHRCWSGHAGSAGKPGSED
jgi:hypothetical protein